MMNAHARDNAFLGAGWDVTAVAELEAMCAAEGCETAGDEALGRHTSMALPTPRAGSAARSGA